MSNNWEHIEAVTIEMFIHSWLFQVFSPIETYLIGKLLAPPFLYFKVNTPDTNNTF